MRPKGLSVLHLSDAHHGGNPSKVEEVLIEVQTPEGELKAGFVEIVENQSPPSPVAC